MLELLMQETRLLRERAGQRSPSSFKPGVQEAGETGDKGVQNPFKQSTNTSSISLAGSMATLVNTNAIGSNVGHLSTNSPTSTANTQLNAKGQGAGMEDGSSASRGSDALPAEMSFYAREIQEQARLITDMIETIDQRSYAISRKTRSLMHEQTLNLHLQQWKELAQRFGYKYLVSMVESFPDLVSILVNNNERLVGAYLRSFVGLKCTIYKAQKCVVFSSSRPSIRLQRLLLHNPLKISNVLILSMCQILQKAH